MRSLAFCAGLLCGLLIAVGIGCFAQTWVVGSGLAIHLDGHRHCNSLTTGAGIEHASYAIGFYRNSNCEWSTYAAKFWTPLRFKRVRGGLVAGAVTGYEKPVLPVAGFVASWEGKKYGTNLIFIPPVGSSGNVAWLQWKVRW